MQNKEVSRRAGAFYNNGGGGWEGGEDFRILGFHTTRSGRRKRRNQSSQVHPGFIAWRKLELTE